MPRFSQNLSKEFLPLRISPLYCGKHTARSLNTPREKFALPKLKSLRIHGACYGPKFQSHSHHTVAHNAFLSAKISPRNVASRACCRTHHLIGAAQQSSKAKHWTALFSLNSTCGHRIFQATLKKTCFRRVMPRAVIVGVVIYCGNTVIGNKVPKSLVCFCTEGLSTRKCARKDTKQLGKNLLREPGWNFMFREDVFQKSRCIHPATTKRWNRSK